MLHAPEWIPAWRLKQAYSLSDSDVISLVQSLANTGHVSLHAAWANFKTFFLLPKIQSLPDHWRSIFDNLGYDPDAPSWIERAMGERDELLEMLRVVASQTDRNGVEQAVDNLYREIYESDTTPLAPAKEFCNSFFYCDGVKNNAFFERVFTDSILFNRVAAIECLKNAHYPFATEVKGITEDFVKTVSSKIQQLAPFPVLTNLEKDTVPDSEPARQGSVEQHIKAWTDTLPKLKGAELSAAKLAIEKWRGKSHVDAYKAAFPNGSANDPKSFVSNKQAVAQKVAKNYGLTMPDWKSA